MCSIFGIEGKSIPVEKLNACFNRTISRGPDMSWFIEIPRGRLGFHRLAIMGLTAEGIRKAFADDHILPDDFRIPNRTWPDCDMNDPSTRVLINYGASGV